MRNIINRILFGGGVFLDLTRWVLLIGIVLVLIHVFLYTVFIVDGPSMEPNLHDREVVFLSKKSYTGENKPSRGDVVVVKYPGDPEHKRYVKRVVGLPGETVKVEGDKVYINKNLLKENYLPLNVETEPAGNWTLNDKEYFLMGDNRPNSNDSRYFGGVEKRFFMGRALYILYPRMRAVEGNF